MKQINLTGWIFTRNYPADYYSTNRICVRTLDLSGDFQSIKKQLDEIAEKYVLPIC